MQKKSILPSSMQCSGLFAIETAPAGEFPTGWSVIVWLHLLKSRPWCRCPVQTSPPIISRIDLPSIVRRQRCRLKLCKMVPTCCYRVSLPAVVGFQVRIILVTCMDLYRSWLRIRMDAMNIFKWSSFGAANLSNLINDCVTFGHWSDWHIGLAATALAAQMVFKSRPWNSQRACRSGRHRIRVISFILVLSCVDHINLPYVLLQIPLIPILYP